MPRNRRLIRDLTLLRMLERSRIGLTLDEMASETGVTTRTIRRDLEALEEAGVPLVRADGRRWRIFDWRKEAA